MSIIFSVNDDDVFGNSDNDLVYSCSEDMKRFSTISKSIGNVVMGRATFESIKTPLKDRKNIVITSDEKYAEQNQGIIVIKTNDEAFEIVDDPLFIGGAKILSSIFNSNIKSSITTKCWTTTIYTLR